MDDRAEGQELLKTRENSKLALSKLDWPTPEMLAAARRARGVFLRELVVALARRLKALVVGQRLAARPARMLPAKVPIARRR
jgi:hypothetical protein